MSPVEWEQRDNSNSGETDEVDEGQTPEQQEVVDQVKAKEGAFIATFREAQSNVEKKKKEQAEQLGRALTEVEERKAEHVANTELIQEKTDEIEQSVVLSLLPVDGDVAEEQRQQKRLRKVFDHPEKIERFMELWIDAQGMPDGPAKQQIIER